MVATIAGLAVLAALAGAAMADRKPVCFVDPVTGHDANAGTTAFPFQTMHRAGQFVQGMQQQRCTVRVEPW